MIAPIIEPPALYRQAEASYYQSVQMKKEYNKFKATYPSFASTTYIDALRGKDYKRLDQLKQIYLDYTGSSLYAESQVQNHMSMLLRNVYGNPLSDNPASQASIRMIKDVRNRILEYFNASPDEYTVVFTQNATGALKHIGESYPFAPGSTFLLTFDNHNSVNGIREFARAKGATITYIPVKKSDLRLNQDTLDSFLARPRSGVNNLFAYPAESNFSGVQHPLEWIAYAQEKGWDVLLDAAAFVPTSRLDLSLWHPDFVTISFYKMFGYPTGTGCLIVKHAALAKLKRPSFAGGTVKTVSVQANGYYLRDGYQAFEDGTANFLSLAAIPIGLRHLQAVDVRTIHNRVAALTDWLIKQLLVLRHSNGTPLIRLYGPSDLHMRGGIVTMNFQNPSGIVIDPDKVGQYASQAHISVRTGCFCNPGSIEIINGITKKDVEGLFNQEHPLLFQDYVAAMKNKTMGALRVSMGIVSNFADVYKFVQFARSFIDKDISTPERLKFC